LAPKKGADGAYSWSFPMGDKRLSGIAAEDIGHVAYAIFKAGTQYVGKRIGIASEHLTIGQMGAQLSKALGIGPITYHAVTADEYRASGFPGADEMGNMLQVYRDFEKEVTGARDTAQTRRLYPGLQTFEQFLAKYKEKIPR
jgi:hypothetical protein